MKDLSYSESSLQNFVQFGECNNSYCGKQTNKPSRLVLKKLGLSSAIVTVKGLAAAKEFHLIPAMLVKFGFRET